MIDKMVTEKNQE